VFSPGERFVVFAIQATNHVAQLARRQRLVETVAWIETGPLAEKREETEEVTAEWWWTAEQTAVFRPAGVPTAADETRRRRRYPALGC
jgi:hypothetical protein